MTSAFLSVSQQVLILFIIILVGFFCTKAKFFTKDAIGSISKFVLFLVTPCVIIESFNREFDSTMLKGLGLASVAALGAHLFNIFIATVCIKEKDESKRCVLRFASVFSNCGYMALPLQNALLGSTGVFYGAVYIAVFNLINWTYGLSIMGGKAEKLSLKKVFVNPGVIGLFVGLILFLTPFKLPSIISSVVKNFSALNTPLPMIVIGYYLAGITTLTFLKDKKIILVLCLRLILLPLAILGVLSLLGLRGVLLTSLVISSSAPVAANLIMFSTMYKRDTQLASALVSISTIFAIITMPILVTLSMSII